MKFLTEHPATVGESYFEHMQVALSFGLRMTLGGLACIVHAVLPAFFTKTGSLVVKELHDRMINKRRTKPLPPGAALDFVI
jgi:hypothetical protein